MRRAALLGLLAVALIAACSSTSARQLPSSGDAVIVSRLGDQLLVGIDRGGTPALVVAGHDIPLLSSSGYAEGARWLAVTTHDDRITAIGGQRGGAHGNVRWTVWEGSATIVREQPQAFETFGGWGMGQLVGAAYVSGQPVVIGSWASDEAGFDIAVWHLDADRWVRTPSTGTPLASSRTTLVQPYAVAAEGDRAVIVGQVSDLATNQVRAAAWLLDHTGWHLLLLPAESVDARADSVACDGSGCVVAGQVDHRLAGWTMTWSGRVTDLDLSAVAPDEGRAVLAVGPPQSPRLVTTSGNRTVWLTRTGTTWQETRGPLGVALAAQEVGAMMVLVVARESGTTLWTTTT